MRLLMAKIKCDVMYDVTAAVTEMIHVYCKGLPFSQKKKKEACFNMASGD